MKSIIQKEKRCYLCGTTYNLHEHHCIHGSGNRKNSEKYGLKIWLCAAHHNMSNYGVHNDAKLDLEIKQMAQKEFEKTHTREEFMKIFGKNYLD